MIRAKAACYNDEGKALCIHIHILWSQQQQRVSGICIVIWGDYKD